MFAYSYFGLRVEDCKLKCLDQDVQIGVEDLGVFFVEPRSCIHARISEEAAQECSSGGQGFTLRYLALGLCFCAW